MFAFWSFPMSFCDNAGTIAFVLIVSKLIMYNQLQLHSLHICCSYCLMQTCTKASSLQLKPSTTSAYCRSDDERWSVSQAKAWKKTFNEFMEIAWCMCFAKLNSNQWCNLLSLCELFFNKSQSDFKYFDAKNALLPLWSEKASSQISPESWIKPSSGGIPLAWTQNQIFVL